MVSVRYLNLRWIGCTNLHFSVRNSGTIRQRRSVLPQMYRYSTILHFSVRNSGTPRRRCGTIRQRRSVLPQMYRYSTILHFSVRKSGTIRQRRSVLPHRPVTIVTGHLPLLRGGIKVPIKLPCVKGNRFGLQPPLRKGEVLHPLEDEAEGYTPRKRGVYGHQGDRTREGCYATQAWRVRSPRRPYQRGVICHASVACTVTKVTVPDK